MPVQCIPSVPNEFDHLTRRWLFFEWYRRWRIFGPSAIEYLVLPAHDNLLDIAKHDFAVSWHVDDAEFTGIGNVDADWLGLCRTDPFANELRLLQVLGEFW